MQTFSADRLLRLQAIERWHFWFAGRRALVDNLLARYVAPTGRTVLDAGCGTGATLERLHLLGHHPVGFDQRPEGVHATRQRLPIAHVFRADACRVPLQSTTMDAAVALDVLEHVDDAAALSELARVLKPGAPFIVTVPALPWLWSHRDTAAGHQRRYTRATLRRAFERAGFDVLELSYYQCLLLPLIIVTRVLARFDRTWRDREDLPPAAINRLFTVIAVTDARAGRWLRWPIGSSLVAVCRAPRSAA